jgi:hypothetical protein
VRAIPRAGVEAASATGHLVQVPAFYGTGDRIEIDTRTNEYKGVAA